METKTDQPKVLVVDDTPTNINVLFDTLEQRGFKVLVASSGESALERALFAKPDLILLDIMMPGIDGFETCKRLKEDTATRNIPVIFMTALSETIDKLTGFRLGAVDYITKPFQVEEVLARVSAHITIEKQRRELSQLNEQLQELNANKDKFFSILSHDLKNVFMYIPQLSKLLFDNHRELSTEEIAEISSRIYDDANNTQALFENLLHWSRIQRGTAKYKPAHFDISEVAKSTIQLFEKMSNAKGIELISNVEDGTEAYADKNMIYTVLRNLVSNALKFTKEGGCVTIFSEKTENVIITGVKDTGIGIPEEKLSTLFRIDVHHTTKGTSNEIGTGLGLILCKELVEKNSGKLEVESTFGEGTIFRFSLPMKEAE